MANGGLLSLLTSGLTAGTNLQNEALKGREQKRVREQSGLLAQLKRDQETEDRALRTRLTEAQIGNYQDLARERQEIKPVRAVAAAGPTRGTPAYLQMIKDEAAARNSIAPARTTLPTEGERKAHGLYLTGRNGLEAMNRLLGIPADNPDTPQREDEAAGKEAPGFFNRQASRIGMGVGNILSTTDLRQLDQTAYDLTEAWLRLTSGAAIGADEIKNAARAIIPQPGDDKATRVQKARSRRLRIEALRQAAGRAIDPAVVGQQPAIGADLDARLDAQLDALLGRTTP